MFANQNPQNLILGIARIQLQFQALLQINAADPRRVKTADDMEHIFHQGKGTVQLLAASSGVTSR